jgi:hypothetical protein
MQWRNPGTAFVVALLFTVDAGAQSKTWTINADFDPGSFTNTSDKPADQVQLGPTRVSQNAIVWSDNYYPAWVVKLDATTGKQLGRYDAALVYNNNDIKQGATGARPAGEYCDWSSRGNCPGRITTDVNADVWIVNRAFGSQGTLSKFSGDINHCIDRNHNGVIDTSSDVNNDGVINPADGKEFLGQNDECILATIPIGGNNEVPRAVAVDKYGKIWVGTWNTQKFYRFDPSEPVTLESVTQVASSIYSAATGGDYVFGSGNGYQMVRLHVKNLTADYAPCTACYGIVADPSGNYAWCGSYNGGVLKGDFTNHTCTQWPTAGWGTLAVTLDMQGNVWAGGYYNSSVFKLSPNGALLGQYPSGGGNPHGISVDFQGNVWTVNDANATMSKLDANGNLIGSYTIGGPTGDNYAPYLYSDFTGVQIDRQSPYRKLGNWRATYDSGSAGVPWQTVKWNTENQGATPQGTSITILVRAGDDVKTLGQGGFTLAKNGDKVMGVVGRYVQVEADMTGPGYATPVLSDVTVIGPCPNGRSDMCCIGDGDCDDKNACTADNCPAPGGACRHVARQNCCNSDKDCDDMNACTADSCSGVGGTCSHAPVPKCCNVDADCADGNACHVNRCSMPGGTCKQSLVNNCCNGNPDCDDKDACTIDLCSGVGGTCSHFPRAGCCNVDKDCDDGDLCHLASCSGPGGSCLVTNKAGCCNVDKDCDDSDTCTDDKCSGAGGVCAHVAQKGCCHTNADCDDKNACTADVCADGQCRHDAVLRCCSDNAQCDDNDACTTDVCSGPGGTCSHGRVMGCCNLDVDCVGDVCSTGACSGKGGTCRFTPAGAGCCKLDLDCDDGNLCTTDSCLAGSSCLHQAVLNCCSTDADCPSGATCTNHACLGGFGDGGAGAQGSGCGCELGARGDRGGTSPLAAAFVVVLLAGALRRRRAHFARR